MDSYRCCAIAGIFLAVFLICLPMFSQGSTGRILGIVTDQSGAVIPGVTVIIRDVDRGTARTLTTDEIMGVDRNLRTPYVSKWNIDIQRAITNNLSLDVAYVGNHGTKLVGLTDLNQPQLIGGFSPGWGNPAAAGSPARLCLASAPRYDNCNPDAGAEQAARPFASKFPYLSYINWLSNNNQSNYHGLQVSMTQRASHGVSFVLGYTYAHALAMSSDNWRFRNQVNSNNRRELYGSSEFDVTHRFTYSTT